MENKEIQEQCNQIKDKLNELGFTEFTLYAADYCGELDEELVRIFDYQRMARRTFNSSAGIVLSITVLLNC